MAYHNRTSSSWSCYTYTTYHHPMLGWWYGVLRKSAGAMHRVENILGPSGPSIYTHTGPSGPVCVLISKNTCTWSVRTKYMLFDLKRHTIRSVRTWWYTRIPHRRCGVERTWPGPSGPGHVRMYTRSVRTWYTYTSKKATPPVPGPLGPGTGNNIFIGPDGPINMYTHVGPSGPTCVCKTKIKRSLFSISRCRQVCTFFDFGTA